MCLSLCLSVRVSVCICDSHRPPLPDRRQSCHQVSQQAPTVDVVGQRRENRHVVAGGVSTEGRTGRCLSGVTDFGMFARALNVVVVVMVVLLLQVSFP